MKYTVVTDGKETTYPSILGAHNQALEDQKNPNTKNVYICEEKRQNARMMWLKKYGREIPYLITSYTKPKETK